MPWNKTGGQRTTSGGPFSPLGPGGQTHVIRLVSKDLHLLSHLTTHQSCLIDTKTGLGSLNDLPNVHELKSDGVGDFSPFLIQCLASPGRTGLLCFPTLLARLRWQIIANLVREPDLSVVELW